MTLRIPIVFLFLLVGTQPGLAQVRPGPPEVLDRFIEARMADLAVPGLAIAIARNGTVLLARGYGVADVQNGAPVTPETRFDLASITKPFTAAAIMLLVEDGRIDLDAPIRTYLPEVPEQWDEVQVRHLLTHTSGLPYSLIENAPIDIPDSLIYQAVHDVSLDFAPGERFQYSDGGYVLLGLITARASGLSWREFVTTRIFAPLGMADTYVTDRLSIHRNESRSYDLRDGELVNAGRVYRVQTPAHNGIFSNVFDLVRWDAALYSDELLGSDSREAMWTPTPISDGPPHPYGLGWALFELGDRPIQLHTGATGTAIVRFPHDTLTVVVLTNLAGSSEAQDIAIEAAGVLIPDLHRGLPVTADQARGYVGEYVSERGPVARVIYRDGKLQVVRPGGERAEDLIRRGGSRFTIGQSLTTVHFLVAEDGATTGVVVYPHYAARAIRFRRR
jgi:D-alanyl-D-alanine carboxypeptidase